MYLSNLYFKVFATLLRSYSNYGVIDIITEQTIPAQTLTVLYIDTYCGACLVAHYAIKKEKPNSSLLLS